MTLRFAAGAGERVAGAEFLFSALGFRISAWSSFGRFTCLLFRVSTYLCGVLGLCAVAGADIHWGIGGMLAMGKARW